MLMRIRYLLLSAEEAVKYRRVYKEVAALSFIYALLSIGRHSNSNFSSNQLIKYLFPFRLGRFILFRTFHHTHHSVISVPNGAILWSSAVNHWTILFFLCYYCGASRFRGASILPQRSELWALFEAVRCPMSTTITITFRKRFALCGVWCFDVYFLVLI